MKQNTDGDGILIVGGYGHVGRLIAMDKAPRFPGRVVVVGRNAERTQAFAKELGNGARYSTRCDRLNCGGKSS